MKVEDWKTLPRGTSVRIKIAGISGTAGYLVTKTKRPAYHVQGKLRLPVEGQDVAVPVEHVEVIPQPVAGDPPAGSSQGAQQPSPYPYPGTGSLTPWARLVEEMKR